MKTNAKKETIIKAVDIVSKTMYEGNILFRQTPVDLTKNVRKFTLKAIDKNASGAFVGSDGKRQPKVDQQVYLDVMDEIFTLENYNHIYCDHNTNRGRIYNSEGKAITSISDIVQPTVKKSTIRTFPAKAIGESITTRTREIVQSKQAKKVLKALKYILDHREAALDVLRTV